MFFKWQPSIKNDIKMFLGCSLYYIIIIIIVIIIIIIIIIKY